MWVGGGWWLGASFPLTLGSHSSVLFTGERRKALFIVPWIFGITSRGPSASVLPRLDPQVAQNAALHSWLPFPNSLALVWKARMSPLSYGLEKQIPLAERWALFLGIGSGVRGICATPRKSEPPHKYLSECLQFCQWICLRIHSNLLLLVWFLGALGSGTAMPWEIREVLQLQCQSLLGFW